MSYCKNCGQGLSSIDKFCHSCGTKVSAFLDKAYRKEYAQQMYKNSVQSLEKEGKSFIEKQIKQQVEKIVPKTGSISQSTQQIQEVFKPPKPSTQTNTKPIESQSGINIWTWIYLAINAILIYLGYRNDDVIGVMLFTIVILLLVFIRRNKPKPYNWVVKIVLILQAVVLIAFTLERIEYLNIITLLMIILFLVNLRLIFKGNKS